MSEAFQQELVINPDSSASGDILVTIRLLGGMDSLYVVPPYGDPRFEEVRPLLAPGKRGRWNGMVDLDGHFGVHPDIAPLVQHFQAGTMAVVCACGTPDKTLSHFEATKTLDFGSPDHNAVNNGWLSRHLTSHDTGNRSLLRAVAVAHFLPSSLRAAPQAIAIPSLPAFGMELPPAWDPSFQDTLKAVYAGSEGMVAEAGRATLEVVDKLNHLRQTPYQPGNGVVYPDTELGRDLQTVAQLIKADVGLEIAVVDHSGWDSHFSQAALLQPLMQHLGSGLDAFWQDVQTSARNVTVVTVSEFGRRVYENAGKGTDHGRGTAIFVLSKALRGGRVYGEWPGLEEDQLDADGNLRITTDMRSVLAEIVERRLNNPHLERVFPGFTPAYLDFISTSV